MTQWKLFAEPKDFLRLRQVVITISQQYDEETGEMGEGKVLAQYCEVPGGVVGYDD